jgi:4-amino-4-deoxy-L-arabinose transferase-like glycosyltransferase
MVEGWQLWTWLVSVLIVVAALLPAREFPRIRLADAKWLLLISLVALLLRLVALDQIPGGLHVDEGGLADFTVRHVFTGEQTTLNPFRTGHSSQPALYHYLIRTMLAIFGYSIFGLRISSALIGTLSVSATYAAVYLFQDRRTALFSAVIMATYHYHIHWSRLALNNIWDTLWVPLILAFFALGWRHQWSGGAVLAGLALGLSQYFYSGSKIAFFLLLFVVVMLYRGEPDRRRLFIHGGKLVITFVTVAAPITIFAFLEPDVYFQRAREVYGWQESAIIAAVGENDLWRYLGFQVWRNIGAFTTFPDITGFYDSKIPFVIGLAAPLFLIGFFWSIWQRQFLPVLWILLTVFFGGIMLNGSPSSSHYVVAIPAICWLTAVPLAWLWQQGRWRLSLLLLAALVATDLLFYFTIYLPRVQVDLSHSMPPWPLHK